MVLQGRWYYDPSISCLPHIEPHFVHQIRRNGCEVDSIPELYEICCKDRDFLLRESQGLLDPRQVEDVSELDYKFFLSKMKEGSCLF